MFTQPRRVSAPPFQLRSYFYAYVDSVRASFYVAVDSVRSAVLCETEGEMHSDFQATVDIVCSAVDAPLDTVRSALYAHVISATFATSTATRVQTAVDTVCRATRSVRTLAKVFSTADAVCASYSTTSDQNDNPQTTSTEQF